MMRKVMERFRSARAQAANPEPMPVGHRLLTLGGHP